MNFLKLLYLRWICRDLSYRQLAEHYLILLKSARRCAYDLGHAVDSIPLGHPACEQFEGRSQMWLKIFSPDGIKDYRTQMHQEIINLGLEIECLRRELTDHGIQSKVPTNYPF